MLKRVIISVFVGMILVVPMAASANSNQSVGNIKNSLSATNDTVQAADNNGDQLKSAATQSLAVDKSEPILPTGWLLTAALLGFVVLSNRSGV